MYKENVDLKSRKYAMGRTLMNCRHQMGLSVTDVVEYLKSNNIQDLQESSIRSWEGGYSTPNAISFLALCDLYNIDNILQTFDLSGGNRYYSTTAISKAEFELIKDFRKKPEYHSAIRKILS